jgi:hypothetical protein
MVNVGVFTAFDLQLTVDIEAFTDRHSVSHLRPNESPRGIAVRSVPIARRDFGGDHKLTLSYRDILGNRYETIVLGTVVGTEERGSRGLTLGQPVFEFVGTAPC